MTVLGRYLAATGRDDLVGATSAGGPRRRTGSAFDEFAAPDGTVRRGWSGLMDGLDEFAETDLLHAQKEVVRLLADDGVTYTPSPMSTISIADETLPPGPRDKTAEAVLSDPRPWELDPVPLVIDEREWAQLEAGLVQRAELLDAVMADLYGAQDLLAKRHIPASMIYDHDEYLRPVVGMTTVAQQRLFNLATDLGRDADGHWKVLSDRTQAPSGAGYAMQNRRVVSRVIPDIYHQAHLFRLTPFFQAMRTALLDAAPNGVENPRVVVLSPGTHSETAFDQAFLASLLGFPLLEGSDLTVREGRVWMRVLGRLEQVDVIMRRVDSFWSDALELRPGSRLGVTGLLSCVRAGTVSVVNSIGSGLLENPALMPLLGDLCQVILGEPLRLPSVDTWWCGDPSGLSHVEANLEHLVVRPISRGHGRSVVGSALSSQQRERLLGRIRSAPHRFVGQEVLPLSSAPTSEHDRLVRRTVVLRSFAVRTGATYTPMLGGLARVNAEAGSGQGPLVTPPGSVLAKDVWVVSGSPIAPAQRPAPVRLRPAAGLAVVGPSARASAAMVPRVLSDLYWFGRYAERAEDLLRLILATRTVGIETDLDVTQGRALGVLLQAVTHVSTTYPGFITPNVAIMHEFRSLLLDRHRNGTAAQALGALSMAAQGVRDQLSEDVWMVLADIDRATGALAANPYDQGLQLAEAAERVLSGLLALAGIVSENMVRDPGWYLLDIGRGLERALQSVSLLRVTICRRRDADTDRLIGDAVLTASESIVTYRRRYRSSLSIEAIADLLLVDASNPRSVAYQLQRILTDLQAIPGASPQSRPVRLVDALIESLRTADLAELAQVRSESAADGDAGELGGDEPGPRPALEELLGDLQGQLRSLSEAIRDQYQQPPPPQQSMWQAWSEGGAA